MILPLFVVFLAAAVDAENLLRNDTKTGRLEIRYKNEWRVIVAENTTGLPVTDYKVICRTLGMPTDNAWLREPGKITPPKNPVALNLTCLGNETSITQCPEYNVKNGSAWYTFPIFAHCDDLKLKLAYGGEDFGAVETLYGRGHPLVCPGKFVDDRRFAQVVCKTMGLKSNYSVNTFAHLPEANRTTGINMVLNCSDDDPASECSIHTDDFNLWCHPKSENLYSAVLCTDQAPQYRLTNIDNSTGIGRLDVKVDSTWGAVCASITDDAFATVACRSLGIPSTNAQSFPYMFMGNSEGGIYQAKCTGNESQLEECRSRWGKKCEQNALLGLSCSNATQGALRLNTLKRGRLQFYHQKQWLGISVNESTSSGLNEATVICRSLNMSTVEVNGTLSNTTESCWLAVERCSGNESSIMDCGNTTISNTPFQCQPLTVICGDGKDDLHIADDGKLEVRRLGVWGSVTSRPPKLFMNYSASFVCDSLGEPSSLASVSHRSETPARTGPIWYTGLECGSDAKSIADCSFTVNGSYTHDADVYISCQELNVSSVKYALSKMIIPEVGIPKISIDGEWGLVCLQQNTSLQSVTPVAKYTVNLIPKASGTCIPGQLTGKFYLFDTHGCFGRASCCPGAYIDNIKHECLTRDGARFVDMYKSYTPKVNTNKIWFDAGAINCTGQEDSILNCTHGYPGDVNLGNFPCILQPIYCGAPQTTPDYTVRLVDGANTYSGRLEMMLFNYWGTICDEQFTDNDAATVCKQVDSTFRKNPTIAKRGTFKSGTGKIWPYEFRCSGSLEYIEECLNLPKTNRTCTHSQDVGLFCETTTNTPKGLSTGAIVGICCGGCVVLVLFVVAGYVFIRRRMRTKKHQLLQ